ncbi:uncharacterized protein EV420DRAFT_1492068 [Desarmillaria tabescens]|uniref:Uncharacterized protein n=1 Tax=Armillaria tabescens TaxID=1929756 RepID=A0AA39U1V8_ARMTA|nr:uncharacterized protein EV420DRAFT_1492068 [Desarmillaria tabescens]KAK0469034.1 hypothetical protein EV420DRAFT_1492068 [Desarmillaria tabescens]
MTNDLKAVCLQHPRNWAISAKGDYPDARCPFTDCLLPNACHIIECGQNDGAYEALPGLSNRIHDICYPQLEPTYNGEPEGFLDVRFPISAIKRYALGWLPHVEMPVNGMMLECQFHETYDRYWWFIYRGVCILSCAYFGKFLTCDRQEAFWTHDKPCPLFQVYGWDPQVHPAERDAHQSERKPRKIKQDPSQVQLQDLRTIISFYHSFGTSNYYNIIERVAGDLPSPKRKAKEQGRSRKRPCSCHDDEDSDTESDSSSDDTEEDENWKEMAEIEQCNITAQTMLILLANCWSIQAGRRGKKIRS